MNERKSTVFCLVIVLLTGWAFAQTAPSDIFDALRGMGLSAASANRIAAALQAGYDQGRLGDYYDFRRGESVQYSPEMIVEWFMIKKGSAEEKESVLILIAQTIEDDLSPDILIDKAKQGLGPIYEQTGDTSSPGGSVTQPSYPFFRIRQEISVRRDLLVEVRALLYSKGIFVSEEGRAGVSSLPTKRFDLLVNNIAAALGDFLEAGGSPLDGYLMEEEVHSRLVNLKGSVIVAEDVDLVLGRIGAADLTGAVRKALE